MVRPIKNPRPKLDLETEALAVLEQARAMAPGPERTEVMKRAGVLRNAADMQGLFHRSRLHRSKPLHDVSINPPRL
jgi:hypothetical protein